MLTCFHASNRHAAFDLVVFNPPYVPTDEDELRRALTTRDISASWAGGPSGRVVIDRFIEALPNVLSDSGSSLAYVVLLEENKPDEVVAAIQKLDGAIECTLCAQRRAGHGDALRVESSQSSQAQIKCYLFIACYTKQLHADKVKKR